MARVVVLGQSGTGKSYYTGYLLEQTVPEFGLAVHMDIEDEEVGLSERGNALYKTVRLKRKMAGRLRYDKLLKDWRKVRIVPEDLTVEEQRIVYAEICRTIMTLCRGNQKATGFISCDEAHNLLSQTEFPKPVERMITGGRKHGVECLHISQRPQLLHTTVIAMADKRIYFGIRDDNDIKKIDKTSNFPASLLKDLPARKCIVENKHTGQWEEIDTDGLKRQRRHYSGDDGIIDSHFPV